MKTFVIYVKGHKKSEQYMNKCIESCSNSNFDAEPFEGVTPATLNEYTQYPEIKNGRAECFKSENKKIYETKKSCFTNHVRIWKKCIELNQPVAFVEQDSSCIRQWNNQIFNEVLILNISSAFKQPVFDHVMNKPNLDLGVHNYNYSPLFYRFNNIFQNSLLIPGTGAYAITPLGAKKLLNILEKHGWDQSDFFINTKNVNLQYVTPEYFTFKLKNLNMSYGF